MAGRLSTSSSSGLWGAPGEVIAPPLSRRLQPRRSGLPRAPWLAWPATRIRRAPAGALIALACVAGIHLLVSRVLVPRPVARDFVRHKVMALTATGRARVVIAGDSRAERHIVPDVIAGQLGLPTADVINIARPACESSGVLAIHREFADRFCPSPIMLISVSMFSVNDRENEDVYLNDAVLWSVGPVDRFRLVRPQRALLATFLPERALYRQIRDRLRPPRDSVPERGFRGFYAEPPREVFEGLARYWALHRDDPAEIAGVRWRQFRRDLESLEAAGVQFVLLDSPEWPRFLRMVAGCRQGEVKAEFSRRLADLCREMDVPLLSYDTTCFDVADPGCYFRDSMHLNAAGARVFSEIVGRDLQRLVGSGRLRMPEVR